MVEDKQKQIKSDTKHTKQRQQQCATISIHVWHSMGLRQGLVVRRPSARVLLLKQGNRRDAEALGSHTQHTWCLPYWCFYRICQLFERQCTHTYIRTKENKTTYTYPPICRAERWSNSTQIAWKEKKTHLQKHNTKQNQTTTSKMHNSTYNGCLVLKKRETKKK